MVTFFSDVSDADTAGLQYTWYFGDGNQASSTNSIARHTYTAPGIFKAQLYVSDGENEAKSQEIEIISGSAPRISLTSSLGEAPFVSNDVITFTGTAFDAKDGDLSTQLEWRVAFIHDAHSHPYV